MSQGITRVGVNVCSQMSKQSEFACNKITGNLCTWDTTKKHCRPMEFYSTKPYWELLEANREKRLQRIQSALNTTTNPMKRDDLLREQQRWQTESFAPSWFGGGGLSKNDIHFHEQLQQRKDVVARRQFNNLQRHRHMSAGGAGPLQPFRVLQLSDKDIYVLTEELHHGNGGDGVYIASAVAMEPTYVVKRMPKHMQLQAYFTNEIKVLQALNNHRHIVRLQHAFERPRYNYIVLEHASKGDLLELVYRFPAKVHMRTRIKYIRQIINGLHYAHQQGYTHRDLKPENIFVKANDDIVIGDWAFATTESSSEKPMGTPEYVSPQILALIVQRRKDMAGLKQWASTQPTSYACKPVDVWALGVLCCDMMFTIDHTEEVLFANVGQPQYISRLGLVKQKRWKDMWNILYPKETTFADLEASDQLFWKTILEEMVAFEVADRATMQQLYNDIHKVPSVLRSSPDSIRSLLQ